MGCPHLTEVLGSIVVRSLSGSSSLSCISLPESDDLQLAELRFCGTGGRGPVGAGPGFGGCRIRARSDCGAFIAAPDEGSDTAPFATEMLVEGCGGCGKEVLESTLVEDRCGESS